MKEDNRLPITGAEIGLAARTAGVVRRTLRRPDPVAVLKRRAAVKEEIQQHLYAKDANWGDPPEIIVVRLGKHDDYPNATPSVFGSGPSNWFKAEVKGLHDRGVETYSIIEELVVKKGKARRADNDSDARTVYVVGRLPYERIGHIDWEPDPTYGAPRFFVEYTSVRRRAYREVVLYERGVYGNDDSFSEVHGVKYVGEGRGPIKGLRRTIRRISSNIVDRRQAKLWRDS